MMNEWYLYENSEEEAYYTISPCSTYDDLLKAISAASDNKIPDKIVYLRGSKKVLVKDSSFKSFYDYFLSKQEKESMDLFITFQTNKVCDVHKEKVMDAFCLECNSLICMRCLNSLHKEHKWKPWEDYVSSIKNQENSTQTFERLNDKSNDLILLIQQLEQFKEKLTKDFETFKNISEIISTKITNKIVNLKDISQSTYDDKLKEYHGKLDFLNETQRRIESISSKLNQRTEDFLYLRAIS